MCGAAARGSISGKPASAPKETTPTVPEMIRYPVLWKPRIGTVSESRPYTALQIHGKKASERAPRSSWRPCVAAAAKEDVLLGECFERLAGAL